MSRGIVGLRGYQDGGILDPDDDIPEWMRRLMEQLRRRGTSDQDIHTLPLLQMEDLMGRPDWDPLNEEEIAEFILGNPDEWDLPGLRPEEPRPPFNILDHWNIQADLTEQLKERGLLDDLEPFEFDKIYGAYDRADPEGQDLLRQLLRRGGMGAYGEDERLGEDLLLRDFESDPQSVEDFLEQVRNEADMDERYERAMRIYLEQNPDVDIHNIPESFDLDDLERLEREVLSVDPVERAAARRAASYAHVGEGIRTPEEQRWLEVFFNKPGQRTPEEIAEFERITKLKTAGPAPEPIYPRASVPESRGARVGGAARRFARSLPWREIGMAGLMTAGKAVFPATVLGDVVQELAINPSEMGSGVPPWMEEGYRTPAEEQKFANDLMAARQDEEILPFTSGRYVPPAVPGAYSTWMPDDLEGIEQLQGDAARFMAGRRRVFRPVRPR